MKDQELNAMIDQFDQVMGDFDSKLRKLVFDAALRLSEECELRPESATRLVTCYAAKKATKVFGNMARDTPPKEVEDFERMAEFLTQEPEPERDQTLN